MLMPTERRSWYGRLVLTILGRCALACVALTGIALAEEEDDFGDVLDGFEDEEPQFEVAPSDDEAVAQRWWDVSGSLEMSGSVNYRSHWSDTGTDYKGLQRLRNRLNVQFDLDLSEEWEFRFDLNLVQGSDFYPGVVAPREKEPKDFEDVELAGAITGIFEGWDVSFHAAWFWNDQPRFRHTQCPSVLVHDRLWMAGSGGNYTSGSWLLKYEVAYIGGIGFFNTGDKDRFDALLGVEYYGFIDTTIVVEGLNRHLFSYDRTLCNAPDFTREDTQEIAVRITRDYLNDTLHFTALGVLFGWDGEDGSIARRLLRRPASIYQLLERMEDQGLVKCIRNTEGKREVRVKMTRKGEEAYQKQVKRHVIPKILSQLSLKEREQLNEILSKLRLAVYAELAPKPLAP